MDSSRQGSGRNRLGLKILSILVVGALGLPVDVFALAPRSQTNDDWTKLEYLLCEFDQEHGGDHWSEPSQASKQQIEALACSCWRDLGMKLDFRRKERVFIFYSGETANRNRSYVLSARAVSHEKGRKILKGSTFFKDRGIAENKVGAPVNGLKAKIGPYHLRGYDYGYSKRYYFKVAGATGLIATGLGAMIKMFLSETIKTQAKPGVKVIYSHHGSSKDAKKMVEVLDDFLKTAGRNPDGSYNAIFIQENIIHNSFILNDLRRNHPEYAAIPDVSLLLDPRYREAVHKAYDAAKEREQAQIQESIARLPSEPNLQMDPGEYMVAALKKRKVPVVFEAAGFDAWSASIAVDFVDEQTELSFRSKNIERYFQWISMLMDALALGSSLRETDLQKQAKALYDERQDRMIVIGRGDDHFLLRDKLKNPAYAFESRDAHAGAHADADGWLVEWLLRQPDPRKRDSTAYRKRLHEYSVRKHLEDFYCASTGETESPILLARQATDALKKQLQEQGYSLESWFAENFQNAGSSRRFVAGVIEDLHRRGIFRKNQLNPQLPLLGGGLIVPCSRIDISATYRTLELAA